MARLTVLSSYLPAFRHTPGPPGGFLAAAKPSQGSSSAVGTAGDTPAAAAGCPRRGGGHGSAVPFSQPPLCTTRQLTLWHCRGPDALRSVGACDAPTCAALPVARSGEQTRSCSPGRATGDRWVLPVPCRPPVACTGAPLSCSGVPAGVTPWPPRDAASRRGG